MFDIERQKEHFEHHVSKFTDYGSIKILDFKNPNSSNYRIRFLFEEDYCRLHISGDLGELSATNYNNMRFEGFSDFINNTGYFKEKIDCHSRAIYDYDEKKAEKDLMKIIEEYELQDEILERSIYDELNEAIDDFISDVLVDFTSERGIGSNGYDIASEIISDFFEDAGDIGKEETGILDLYMLAFKLAKEQLN